MALTILDRNLSIR